MNKNDDIIIDGKRYVGTTDLYELFFAIFPDKIAVTNHDKQIYKSILLATNAHRRGYNIYNLIMSNRGHKYMNIIKPLLPEKKLEKIPRTMTLNDNKIDYVH